jgi:hypothetical protein
MAVHEKYENDIANSFKGAHDYTGWALELLSKEDDIQWNHKLTVLDVKFPFSLLKPIISVTF